MISLYFQLVAVHESVNYKAMKASPNINNNNNNNNNSYKQNKPELARIKRKTT